MNKLTGDYQELESAKNIVNKIENQVDNETKDLLDTLTILENTKKSNKKMEEIRGNV